MYIRKMLVLDHLNVGLYDQDVTVLDHLNVYGEEVTVLDHLNVYMRKMWWS